MPQYVVEPADPETGEFVVSVDSEIVAVSPVAALAYQALADELLADEAAE